MVNRRAFLQHCAALAWIVLSGSDAFAEDTGAATLTVKTDRRDHLIPANFLGLSYEASLVADPDFFSASNQHLLGLMHRLGSAGVIRIGGNSSDHILWRTNGDTTPVPKMHILTPADVQRLGAFIKASGWQLIYGLNLGTGTTADAADQAAAVTAAAGDSLLALQIGNEPNLYSHNGLRPKTYTVQDYLTEWQTFADAVRARVPNAPLAGPDSAGNGSWVTAMGRQDAHELVLLSQHYYTEGPGSSPKSTIDRMLRSGPGLDRMLRTLQQAAKRAHLPYRMTEANSCYGGGKYGVSDTLAAALWGVNFLYQTASRDGVGINFHGGTRGAYSPIIRSADGTFSAQPLYYGMLFFAQGAQGRLAHVDLQNTGTGVTAYATHNDTQSWITVVNTDAAEAIDLTVDPGRLYGQGTVLRLTGPALDATTDVVLGSGSINGDGTWAASTTEAIAFQGQKFALTVPAASAVLVTLSQSA